MLVDPDCDLSSATGPHHCIHLQPATPSVHLYASGPTPIISLHFSAPETRPRSHSISDNQDPCSCQHTHSWPWSSLPALAPHHYIFVCNRPPPLHRSLQLALTAKHTCTTSSSCYHCLFLSLTTRLGCNAENPYSPCELWNPLWNSLSELTLLLSMLRPQRPERMSHCTFWPHCQNKPL